LTYDIMNSNHSSICFSALRGQGKAKKLLRRTLAAGRIPHAYIFRGPDGVGKSMFARGVAAAINCHDTSQVEACGVCSSCRKFRSGNHPDILVVSPEKGAIKIGQIRQMSRELTYPAYESKMRVVILEDVHTMRREAANSLLKTLEEPPADNLLVLTARASHGMLSTLTSRCQTVPFSALTIDDTASILMEKGLDTGTAQLLAQLSEGSPGKAVLLNKKDIISLWKEVLAVVSDSGIDSQRDVGIVLQLGEKMAALKENIMPLLGLLRIWLRDLLMGNTDLTIFLEAGDIRLKKWNSEQLFARLQAIDQAEKELARNCNRSLVCEVLLFRLQ